MPVYPGEGHHEYPPPDAGRTPPTA